MLLSSSLAANVGQSAKLLRVCIPDAQSFVIKIDNTR